MWINCSHAINVQREYWRKTLSNLHVTFYTYLTYTPKKDQDGWITKDSSYTWRKYTWIYQQPAPLSLPQSTLNQGVMLNWLQYPKVYSYIIEKENQWWFISLLRIGTWGPSQSELMLLSVWSQYHGLLYLTEGSEGNGKPYLSQNHKSKLLQHMKKK